MKRDRKREKTHLLPSKRQEAGGKEKDSSLGGIYRKKREYKGKRVWVSHACVSPSFLALET